MIISESEIVAFTDIILKAADKALPKGKTFETLTNKEKAEFFWKHKWDGKKWVNITLIGKVSSALSNIGKSATVGATTPDKLIPGLSDPKTKFTKTLSFATRAAVLATPGGMPVGAILGAIFGAAQPDKVDKSYDASKKMVASKLAKIFKRKGK